jgi:hypothetical protein
MGFAYNLLSRPKRDSLTGLFRPGCSRRQDVLFLITIVCCGLGIVLVMALKFFGRRG